MFRRASVGHHAGGQSKLGWKYGILASAILAAGVSSAKASLVLTLSEPGYSPLNLSATVEPDGTQVVEYFGAYGDFSTDIILGSDNSLNPDAGPTAELQVQSLNITKTGISSSAPLTLTLSDSGFDFPGNSGSTLQLSSSLGGTVTNAANGDQVDFQSYVNGSITPGLQTKTFSADAFSQEFDVPDAFESFVRGDTYSLESVATFDLSNVNESVNVSGTTISSVEESAIPEPGMVGLGLIGGVGLLARRRRRGE